MTAPPDDTAHASDVERTRASASAAPFSTNIGPYRLLERIGEGGMGEVWLAEQSRPVHRQVALKVIKAGMDTAQVVARFDAERQALALMDHPAIARVFDGGATPEGRPYFVMEFVRGESITSYVARHKLTIEDRINLFVHVCEGVQHAHQKGVIHRDLKPSNVLITIQDDRPVPKIIDFGVAKATSQPLTDRTLHTEYGMLIGTPEYMSPEQAEMSALDVDTRSDVYSLGVILYELLTNCLPFESEVLRARGIEDIRRIIREVDPPRPSTRVMAAAPRSIQAPPIDRGRLASQLRGDLDWIAMKALEKDRTRRYATVGELAADLLRHLDNEPVLASPPSTLYRAHKFIRRNRAGVTGALTLVLLLVMFAGTMAVQAQRIKRERDRANQEAATATQVSDFLSGLFTVSDPSEARGNTLTAREILDKGALKISTDLANQPVIQARLMATMGNVYTSLGMYRSAEPLLQRAVAIDRNILGNDDPQTLVAVNELANVYWFQDRTLEAEPLYLDVVNRRTRQFGPEHPDTLRANYDLASLYAAQRRWAEAERIARVTLDRQRRVLGVDHTDTLGTLGNLASIYYRQGRFGESLPLAQEAMTLRHARFGDDDPRTLTGMHNLATNYDQLARYAEAEALYLRTLAGERRILGASHPSTVQTMRRLASMYQKQQRYADAELQLLTALNSQSLTHSPDNRSFRAVTSDLADLYGAWGKIEKAAEWRAKLSEVIPKP